METKILQSMKKLISRGNGANLNLFRYAAMVAVLLTLGIGNAWAGHGGKCTAKLQVNTGTGSGSVYAATTSSATSGNSSVSADCGNSDDGTHTHTFYAFATPAAGYTFLGWTESATSTAGADASNPKAVTITSESHNTVTKTLYAHFVEKAKVNITFEAPSNGTYTIAVNGGSAETVSSANVVKSNVTGVTLTATPASGYAFAGWYKLNSAGEFVEDLSIDSPYDASFTASETIKMGARFVPTTLGKFILKGSETQYYGLKAATIAAGGSGVIVPVAAETVVDGSDLLPFDNGTYIIKAGATLLVPHSSANSVQIEPEVVTTANPLSAYRTLHLIGDVNVICNGVICVGGKIMSASGGSKSAYPTDACGVINMAKGGHIELNNGAKLYCWGFVKGQDMDQGNNTVGVGTITANAGAVIKEDFAVGDWRGGTATSAIYNKRSSWKLFPFQSYSIQNVEVPTTFKYGSTLNTFVVVSGGGGNNPADFDIAGSNNTLFLLRDDESVVRKWYDPTTDLTCYELSGSAKLDALNIVVYISLSSGDFYLPISNSMHVILKDCNMTMSKPMTMQAGSVIEIKEGATANLESRLHLFDKDEWGLYIHDYYFRSFNNLTSHKNRGAENSKDGLDDAKLIVDGTLNVVSGKGYLYTSKGGANVMGNGGGKVVFGGSLPSGTESIHHVNTASSSESYIKDSPNDFAAANLCNEDGSYTKSIASTTFHNVNGRWFAASAKDEKANHTYDFTYISSGVVSGTGGTSSTTDAVYSNDKTGMEARMKWANVTADACADWWHGKGDQAGWFYNWTMNSAWHQFQTTETEGMYSGSNNKIYTKTDCNWEELGETDVNCLYTIDGKKKALVDGHFIELEPNSDDAAFHEAADPTKYYICFEGCNWHAATKYEGEKKAYVVDETTFIWFEERWMAVEREEPFFYTKDETNVTIYYEYIGSEWVLAQPYVEVTDAIETRQLLRFNEAITVASAKKNVTIKLLRDLVNITTPMTFTGASTTCTLDLNGHVAEVHVDGAGTSEIKMLTLNGASTTFTITDNTTDKKGELKLIASVNTETSTKRWSGIYVQNGSLVLQSGKVYVEHPFAWVSNSNTGLIRGILVASAKTFTMNGGTLEVVSDYNTYGVEAASGTPTVNIHGGTIECVSTTKSSPYGIIGYGTINIDGGYIHANAKANSTAKAVYANVSSSAKGTINISGGRLYAESTSSACGVHCAGTAVVTGDYNATTPNNTPKARYYAVVNITGGEITAVCRTSTTSYGVLSYGTTTISGGTITSTVQKSNQNTAYGVCTIGGTTTISTGANITANAPTTAYGVTATAANADSNRGWPHVGVVNITGGTITANTTNGTTAYGLLVTGTTYTISRTDGYKVFNGDYAAAGTATVTGGTFYANAKTTLARGIAVAATKTKNEASATPKCTINGGYYKMTGTGDLLGCNASALAADFHINGGYYSHDGNLATYAVSPKHVLTLASGDANRPPYYYKVAEAYLVTFKNEDGTANIIDPIYQEVNTKPVCSTEPTKASTSTNSFTFDGWATAANGDKVYEKNGLPNVTSAGATYYAHFATTTLKYRVHLDATENGGECATENIYVEPGTAVGTLPTATKYGYTFSGWFTAASGGTKLEATTVINANADYYAQFMVNSHTLTWDLAGGAVGTAGKIGSTTWPAKNATGTQSRSVAYGTVLTTIPVVTKTGYVFNRWDPVPTSSMPDNDVTYTALWNPATNTKYYVKHYQQNIDDDNYTLVETDNLTGTTGATVTPDRKSYDGFLTPTPQQLTIGAAGTSELVYNYDRVVYTINWNASANGGACATASTDVRHGANIALPAATKAGHILEGWYTKAEGGNKISEGATILQNYGTLYAQFIEVPTYKLTWDWNGGETSSTSYTAAGNLLAGTTINYPANNSMSKTGYTFAGWSSDATSMPDADLTITASWTVNTHKLAWNFDGGTPSGNYTEANNTLAYGSAITYPTLSKTGYTFAGWSSDATSMPDADLTITASWTVKTHKLAWNFDGGTPSGNYTEANNALAYGSAITYPTLSKTGYTFAGWSSDATSMPDADLTITASWTANTNTAYKVEHYKQKLDGTYASTPDETDNLTGTTATEVTPAVKSYEGFDAPSTQKVTILADGSQVVTYQYIRKSYNLSWVTDGDALTGDYTNGSTKFGAAITAPETPTKTGYDFAGWDAEVASTMPAEKTTYTATWTIKQYTLTVQANDPSMGTVTGGGEYDYNSVHTIKATPKSGFKFVQWNDGDKNASREVTVTADVTFTATFDYDIANYTVKHWQQNINDDKYTEVVADRQTDLSGTIGTATAAEAKNYTGFTLKSPIEQQTIALSGTVVNIYYDRITYTIIWDVKLNGEQEAYKKETLRYGATPSFGPDPTKEQTESQVFTFSGWTPTPYAVYKDQTYNGSFNVAARTYDVTWNNTDGTEIDKEAYTWGAQPSFPGSSDPVYNGNDPSKVYIFRGWKYERTGVEYKKDAVLPGVAGNETYTAVYTQMTAPIDVANGDTKEIETNTTTPTTTVRVGGILSVAAGKALTTTTFILEASADASGQIMETGTIEADNVYFDLTLNTLRRHWRAFTVPFEVNLKQHPILADGVSMPLGVQYDIVYYDGAERAAHGKTPDCWRYVEDDENWILTPGRAYMIVFGRDVNTVRFTKENGASINYTGDVVLAANSGDGVNGGWNGIGNPATYHAMLSAGVTTCQVHNGEEIGSDGYIPCDMGKFIVGKAVFVQVAAEQTVVVNKADSDDPVIAPKPQSAPRRAKANATGKNRFDVQIAPVDGQMADRMFLHADEYKEDKYVILQDLAKAGLSTKRAQIWVERYDTKLCKNTALLFNGVAEFPLGIFAPQAGEYEISVAESPDEESTLYLTLDGVPVWNLSYGPYTANLEKGTTARYGLKWVRNYVPAISTSVDNTQADKQPTAQKILLNDKVYILRGENVYSADGQLVK